jgi:hypothetical protein
MNRRLWFRFACLCVHFASNMVQLAAACGFEAISQRQLWLRLRARVVFVFWLLLLRVCVILLPLCGLLRARVVVCAVRIGTNQEPRTKNQEPRANEPRNSVSWAPAAV